MINTLTAEKSVWNNSQIYQSRESLYKMLWHLCLLGLVGVVSMWIWRRGPDPAVVAWLFYIAGAVSILIRPRYGIYLILFFGLAGDSSLMYWYPFEKNFSSAESLLYINDSVIISPLESFIILTFLSWIGRIGMRQRIPFYTGELMLPALLFGLFAGMGVFYGLATGGSMSIALWESRPIFYLPVMLVLVSNLIQERGQIKRLMWLCIIAIFIEGIVGSYVFLFELGGNIAAVDRLAAHSSAIHINSLFIFIAASWLYRMSAIKRVLLLLMIPPVALTYLVSQRRAAFVTLAVALIMVAAVLFIENRRAFWILAPISAMIALAYLAVFWNSYGALGLPARAIKSVVAPDPNSQDTASNIYRAIENVNINFTIHQSPLFGVGFGKKFMIVIPMADISFFDWWEYIVHNSVFWIWMKMGVHGFMSMFFLIASTIMIGVRVILRLPSHELNAVALTCTLYVIMHFMYAYVDMSWDNQSMIYVGASMGMLNCFEHVVNKPTKIIGKRWHWQKDPEPEPSLAAI